MMTAEDLAVLENFAAVWERVSGAKCDGGQEKTAQWETLLQELYEQMRCCEQMASSAAGTARKRLWALARELKEALNEGETEYFLKNGECFQRGANENFASYTPYNLRKLCKNAEKLARALQDTEEEAGLLGKETCGWLSVHPTKLKELLRDMLR